MKIQAKDSVWLFPDSISAMKDKRVLGKLVSVTEEVSATGLKVPVAEFSTELHEKTKVSMWRLNVTKAVKIYGDDTDKWIGKDFYISPAGAKDMLLTPLEERV
jgi:hypothetical protein